MNRWFPVVLALMGCRTQVGVGSGVTTRITSGGAQPLALVEGGVSGDFTPGTDRSMVVGGNLDLHSAINGGSRLLLGLRAGYTWNSVLRPNRVPAGEILGEVGVPVRAGIPFYHESFYLGLRGSIYWWLGPSHEGAALNRALWYFHPVPQLVLYAGVRTHIDDPGRSVSQVLIIDATAGIALRYRFVSDLF